MLKWLMNRRNDKKELEIRASVFGVIDMRGRDVAEHEGVKLSFRTRHEDRKGRLRYLGFHLETLCAKCGVVLNIDYNSYATWEQVLGWAARTCNPCMRDQQQFIDRTQQQLDDDDVLRAAYAGIIKRSSGVEGTFSDHGNLVHSGIRWLGGGWWLPTWLDQDGSSEAIAKIHQLGRDLNVHVKLKEGFLVLMSVQVMAQYRRNSLQHDITKAQEHLESMQNYAAEKAALS